MRGNELLDRMDLIDPEYVAAADEMPKKRRKLPSWLAVAACLPMLLLLTQWGIMPERPVTPTRPNAGTELTNPAETESSESKTPIETIYTQPVEIWDPVYNTYPEEQLAVDSKLYAPAYFAEKLSEETLRSLTPEQMPDWMALSGYVSFLGYAGMEGEPELIGIRLYITTDLTNADLFLDISKYNYVDCVIQDFEPIPSLLDGISYTCYQWQTADGLTHLKAEAVRDGWTWCYVLSLPSEQTGQGKDILETVVPMFSTMPDFRFITASKIPNYLDEKRTIEEALEDPEFGAYFLRQVPSGFVPENIRRYMDYQSDYLYGFWSRGYGYLRWQVSRIADEDRARITAVDDRENYDLSLYPIPRADSVPEELREIVDHPIFLAEELSLEVVMARAYRVADAGDTDGWRMNFSVLYGDMLVAISAKDVDPQWVYDQIAALTQQ